MIMQAQWWDVDIRLLNLRPAPVSDAYLINGLAGDSYPCSKNSNTHLLFNFTTKIVKETNYIFIFVIMFLFWHLIWLRQGCLTSR